MNACTSTSQSYVIEVLPERMKAGLPRSYLFIRHRYDTNRFHLPRHHHEVILKRAVYL
jgi:hypothetical protein